MDPSTTSPLAPADLVQAGKIRITVRTLRTSFMLEDTSYDAIRVILNTEDEEERDRLTEKWQSHKLEELSFVGIVVRF